MSIERLFIHTLEHWRPSKVSDGQGGYTETFIALDPIRGRMRPASATDRMVASQTGVRMDHVFYCLASEDIQRGDQLRMGNHIWEVVDVREPSLMERHYEVDCYTIQKAP